MSVCIFRSERLGHKVTCNQVSNELSLFANDWFSSICTELWQNAQSMVWNSDLEYPRVRKFAQNMKDAILAAHDAILMACVKKTHLTNSHRKEAPFSIGDMVYLSTANLTLPKGCTRKLAPKFLCPYRILEEYKNNSFKLDLPSELKQWGLHPSFHANLLRIHVPNDDR